MNRVCVIDACVLRQVVVGPVIGKVSETEARVLLEIDGSTSTPVTLSLKPPVTRCPRRAAF